MDLYKCHNLESLMALNSSDMHLHTCTACSYNKQQQNASMLDYQQQTIYKNKNNNLTTMKKNPQTIQKK